jgi:hemerythrin
MDRFALTGDLVSDVPDIDDQHRALLELGNRVVDPATLNQGAAVFREALSFLAGYVRYHFAAEEHVMHNAGYPRLAQHKQWHDRFRQNVDGLAAKARSSGVSRAVALEISFAMETWFLEHIRITDRDMAVFLREQHSDGRENRLPDVATLKRAGALAQDFDERLVQVVVPAQRRDMSYGGRQRI